MGNSWFQFKQFRVEQAGAALKVGTDACILGAWAHAETPHRILDIGTGTGLLALMLAQRYSNAQIDALEPEPGAARQARENFLQSPWQQQLQLHQVPVQEFNPAAPYDLIICNPPFYPKHLKTSSHSRNMALHQENLSFEELARACNRLLSNHGLCFVLLPPRQTEEFTAVAAQQGLHLQQVLAVQERTELPVHRVLSAYARKAALAVHKSTLIIRNEAGDYSPAYKTLLKEYYLKF